MCAQCASCDNDIFSPFSLSLSFSSSFLPEMVLYVFGHFCFHAYDACFASPFHVNCSSRMFTIYKINNYAPNRVYRTSCAQFHNKCESPNNLRQFSVLVLITSCAHRHTSLALRFHRCHFASVSFPTVSSFIRSSVVDSLISIFDYLIWYWKSPVIVRFWIYLTRSFALPYVFVQHRHTVLCRCRRGCFWRSLHAFIRQSFAWRYSPIQGTALMQNK